ncbi:hypothetical protein C8R44DRAFT_974470 [Mycena epipterygia]|nr:hypothetical protein C8R44DRAFT_974470 [Mycena epipterygia]
MDASLAGYSEPSCGTTDIVHLISKNEAIVREIEVKIMQHAISLASLAGQRHSRQQTLALLRAALSPVQRMPAEILAQIFMWCLNDNLHHYSLIDPRNSPMILTRVCARWRAVALATSRLWENMSLRFDESPACQPSSFLPELLQRSLPHPLFVDIRASLASTYSELGNVFRLMDRAQTLKLHLPSASLECLAGLPEDCMPSLRTLHLRADARWSERPVITPWTGLIPAFTSLPHLRHLILDFVAFGQALDIFTAQFPWAQLTYLNLGLPLTILAARSILAQCVNLTDGSFWRVQPSVNDDPAQSELVTLPHLRRFVLRLALHDEWEQHRFFDGFAFPELLALQIDDQHACPPSSPSLPNLLQRSRFLLHELTLERSLLAAEELLSLLRQLPTLRELNLLHCSAISNKLFDALTYHHPETVSPALPSLERLELQCSVHTGRWSPETLADMIESRLPSSHWERAPTVLLQRVIFMFWGDRTFFTPSVERRFQKMVAGGLLIDRKPSL